jgi:hypothetical protein
VAAVVHCPIIKRADEFALDLHALH